MVVGYMKELNIILKEQIQKQRIVYMNIYKSTQTAHTSNQEKYDLLKTAQ